MAMFQVRFLKHVCNDTGHMRKILQRAIVVEAAGDAAAGDVARDLFCAREGIGHWRQHADDMIIDRIAPSDEPARHGETHARKH